LLPSATLTAGLADAKVAWLTAGHEERRVIASDSATEGVVNAGSNLRTDSGDAELTQVAVACEHCGADAAPLARAAFAPAGGHHTTSAAR
jgi:hypothetical protein